MPYDPEQVAGYYAVLFAARTDVYSHWVTDPRILKNESPRWQPAGHWSGPRDARVFQRDPLTAEIVLAALRGTGPSVSGYMIAPGGVTHVWAIDLDTDDGLEQAYNVGSVMLDRGVQCYVEPSRRGAHLWGCLDEQMPARTVRRMLRSFVEAADVPKVFDDDARQWVHDPKVELRPGTDELPDGGLGHALRMPTMPHPKTGRRAQLYVPYDRKPVPGGSLGEVLTHIVGTPRGIVETVAMEYVPEIDPRHLAKGYRSPKAPRGPDEFENASASEILRDLWGVQNARPGRAVKCPAHEDQHPSLSILRDDRRVICRGSGCVLNNDGHGRGTYELTKYAPVAAR
jgi:hypothetical protein